VSGCPGLSGYRCFFRTADGNRLGGSPDVAGLLRGWFGWGLVVDSVVKDRGRAGNRGVGLEARTQFARRLILGFG
jgi:hypothetical protein